MVGASTPPARSLSRTASAANIESPLLHREGRHTCTPKNPNHTKGRVVDYPMVIYILPDRSRPSPAQARAESSRRAHWKRSAPSLSPPLWHRTDRPVMYTRKAPAMPTKKWRSQHGGCYQLHYTDDAIPIQETGVEVQSSGFERRRSQLFAQRHVAPRLRRK